MKIQKLLTQYKQIAKEIKILAKRYKYLDSIVRTPYHNQKQWEEYKATWTKLNALNNQAYGIMREYRTLADSAFYKVLFALHIMKKQNTFRFLDSDKCRFKADQLINLVSFR